jgi:hypothetical protein
MYNLGFSKTNMFEMYRMLKAAHQRKKHKYKLIVLGLGFFAFNQNRKLGIPIQYKRSLFSSNRNYYFGVIPYLLGLSTFRESILTLIRNRLGHSSLIKNGFLDPSFTERSTRSLNVPNGFKIQLIKAYLCKKETYGDFRYSKSRIDLLREVIDLYLKSGTRIVIFISPIHALQQEAIFELGLYPFFKRWKKDLAETVGQFGMSQDRLALWDFTGYNSYNIENFSDRTLNKEMKWYIDSSHFKKALGDLVLDRIIGQKSEPKDFGTIITKNNISSHIKKIESDRIKYREDHFNEVQDLKTWVKDTSDLRTFVKF